MRFVHRFLFVVLVVTVAAALTAGAAFAKGPGGGRTGSSSLSLVLLNSTDGVPHYGQQVTFNVSTTATDQPFVRLNCYQGATEVYWASAGFYDGYPWPWTRNFTLSSSYWTGGAASCIAELYYTPDGGKRFRTLASLSFEVSA
jgi:hypothetical protein